MPDDVDAADLADRYAALLDRERQLVAARERVAALDERFRHAAPHTDGPAAVEMVRGAAGIRWHFFQLQRDAPGEVRGTEGPPYLVPDTTVDNNTREVLAAGTRYRILYDRRALDVPGRPYGDLLDVSDGRLIRIGTIPVKLLLTDAPAGLLAVPGPGPGGVWTEERSDEGRRRLPGPGARASEASASRHSPEDGPPAVVLVRDPALLAALSALFELYWERAVPVSVRAEADVLPLLVAGLTDQEIAAKLGWSHRTVRRRVRDLMARLGAQTRFQAGYAAVRRGWLEGNDDAD
ncbi:helix-turn-helix transcriptional regulator [Phytohabitans rumicis]|uniref:Transcriptional regulator n=1 Tax=Phytohabitans rumicis TaxID=1076125 RepID=A0A6V8LLM2_9ACTN|nr:helix-turn-helix transcriptional regulator [Phytohabitans rumicis]GFJ95076.1 transcriptional regulator [Phytohabitans rumicis]